MANLISFELGRVYGYNSVSRTLLPFHKKSAEAVHDAIGQCLNDYVVMFNMMASLCFFKYVMEEDLTRLGMSDDMKQNFKEVAQGARLDKPLVLNILEQAFRDSLKVFTEETIKRLKEGTGVVPFWGETGESPFVVPASCVELLSVVVGQYTEYYFCCNLFNPEWAAENRLPAWIAFEILESAGGAALGKVLGGENKAPEFLEPEYDNVTRIESRILIKSHKAQGSVSLQLQAEANKYKYVLHCEKN